MNNETETLDDLRVEASGVVDRLNIKVIEVINMMKDGKFIVAHEKLGGVQKVLNQLHVRLQTFQSTEIRPA